MNCSDCTKGVVGLAKAGLQAVGVAVDQARDDVVQARRDQCRACEFATRNHDPKHAATKGLTNLSRCTICNCFLAAKTRLASEQCPLPIPRWPSTEP
ncbi:MAG TPA: hypothetical protein VGN72_07545 [Tepidisphaeraceae bacterium]|jgi:flavoprotein|nr:hypothetical protein [Tepidisphaeraceae bacterium]